MGRPSLIHGYIRGNLTTALVPETESPIKGGHEGTMQTSATIPSSIALRVRAPSQHLFRLGERPVFEWCCEVIGGADPLARLERYAQLDPDTVRELGGDVMPPTIHRVK